MRTLLFLLLPIVALGFAPAPVFRERPDDPEVVLRQLQGTWTVPRYERCARTVFLMGEAYIAKIEKDQWTFSISENDGPFTASTSCRLKLNPKASSPEVDIIGSDDPPFRFCGVYDLKGDTLKIVFRDNSDGKEGRAKDIINPGPGDWFMQLERQR